MVKACTEPNLQPEASLALVSTNGYQVDVDGSASSDADGSIVSYEWDFGDGNTANGATATHTYAGAGTYTITLTVTDNRGDKDTETLQVTLDPIPDDEAPTVPANLRTVSVTDQTASITWDASTDNIGVTGYNVYLDGALYQTVATPGLDVEGLTPGTSYTIVVEAIDAAGNISGFSNPLDLTTSNCSSETVYLSDMQEVSVQNGYGDLIKDNSNGNDGPITIGGVVYEKGLGAHVYSEIVYDLNGAYDTFLSDIGADDGTCDVASVVFEVYTDGVLAYRSPVLEQADAALSIEVDVQGVDELMLVANNSGDYDWCDHANWADARVTTSCEQIIPQSIAEMPVTQSLASPSDNQALQPVGVTGMGFNSDELVIRQYPNPFSDKFTLEWNLDTQEKLKITIVDKMGKVVYHRAGINGVNTFEVDGSRWATGTYIVKVESTERSELLRIVKKH